jgi:hypothetical protein
MICSAFAAASASVAALDEDELAESGTAAGTSGAAEPASVVNDCVSMRERLRVRREFAMLKWKSKQWKVH